MSEYIILAVVLGGCALTAIFSIWALWIASKADARVRRREEQIEELEGRLRRVEVMLSVKERRHG
jgi:hypothetical protein